MKTFHYYRRPGARIRTALQAKSLISTHFLALKTTFIIASHLMRISTFLDHKLLLSIMGYCLGQITIAMVQWSATDRRISVDRRRVATVTTFTGTNQRNHHSSCVLQSAYSLELADCNSHRYLKPPPPPPKPPPNIKRTWSDSNELVVLVIVTRSYSTSRFYPQHPSDSNKDDTRPVAYHFALHVRPVHEHPVYEQPANQCPADRLHGIRIGHRIQDVVDRGTHLSRLSGNSLRPAASWSLAF